MHIFVVVVVVVDHDVVVAVDRKGNWGSLGISQEKVNSCFLFLEFFFSSV